MPQDESRASSHSENVYHHIYQKIGDSGKYQFIIGFITLLLCFEVGILMLGPPYFFAIANYTGCPKKYKTMAECTQYVCSLPATHRKKYEGPQMSSLTTFGNLYGNFQCHNSNLLQSVKGVGFLGAITGYLFIGIIADNFGRRAPFIIWQAIGLLGALACLLAPDLIVMSIGMFAMGFGTQCCFGLAFSIQKEIMSNYWREKMEILVQTFCCIGGIGIIVLFYYFKNVILIFWIYVFVPLLLCFIMTIYFFKETPRYLVKMYSIEEIQK